MKLKIVVGILFTSLLCLNVLNIGNGEMKDTETVTQVERPNDLEDEELNEEDNEREDFTPTHKDEGEVVVEVENKPQKEPQKEVQKPIQQSATFRVTAYCACEQCCGKWASNRPLDENGKPIVQGASGNTLISNVSCASPLPFGTQIELEGIGTVVVHDRTANWVVDKHGTYICDIYMDDHQAAYNFGLQYIEGRIL